MGKYPPFGILDIDSECILNKKLKMRPVKKSCSAQNLHRLQTLFAQPDTREEKRGLQMYFSCYSMWMRQAKPEEALPAQGTKGKNSSF